MDYFLARYYSSTQGRFTSPDEFTGGPEELYTFADDASDNPTFYADLTNPQSLNKYQYSYNNPLRYVDADGHCPECAVADAGVAIELAPIPIPALKVAGAALIAGAIVYHNWDSIKAGAKAVAEQAAKNGEDPEATSIRQLQDWTKQRLESSQGQQDTTGNQIGRGSQNPNTAEAAKEGRAQHKDFAEKVKAKPGWRKNKEKGMVPTAQ